MDISQISDSEWKIMKILWSNSPATSNDIIAQLSEETGWKPTTVKTLLSRLVKKEVVGFEKRNRTYHYFPLVTQETCVKAESKSFLERVYGGAFKTMMANFVEMESLSDDDIADLKRILEKKK